jgi:hypothetical protein
MVTKSDHAKMLNVDDISFLAFERSHSMDTERADARKTQNDELNEALETDPAEERDGLSIQNQRLARIQEYEEGAISRPDPRDAMIGMGSATLQRMFEHLGEAIVNRLDSYPHTFEEVRELSPEMRLALKLRSAIETDLTLQTSDTGPQATAFPPRRNGKELDTNLTTNKRGLVPKRWMGNS